MRALDSARDFAHNGSRQDFASGWAQVIAVAAREFRACFDGDDSLLEETSLGPSYDAMRAIFQAALDGEESETLAMALVQQIEKFNPNGEIYPPELTWTGLREFFFVLKEAVLSYWEGKKGEVNNSVEARHRKEESQHRKEESQHRKAAVQEPTLETTRAAIKQVRGDSEKFEYSRQEIMKLLGCGQVDPKDWIQSSVYVVKPPRERLPHQLPRTGRCNQPRGKDGKMKACEWSWPTTEVLKALEGWVARLERD